MNPLKYFKFTYIKQILILSVITASVSGNNNLYIPKVYSTPGITYFISQKITKKNEQW